MLASGATEDADMIDGLLDAPEAAAVHLQRDARAFDLARAARAAQLLHQFENLPEAGRADRVSLRLQPARGVDGEPTAYRGLAGFSHAPAVARLAKADILHDRQFADGGRVVQLGDAHIARPDARLLVHLTR